MKDKIYSILQPDDSRAVEFAAKGEYPQATGTLFKKRIINFGEYADQWMPDYFFTLDEAWGQEVLNNFKAKTVGRVYVPASHTDDPDKNRGEVIDMFLSEDGKGIDAILDIRDPETVQKINDDLIWDNSIGFTMNWISKTGEEKGAAIYHVALVNNPYIEDMTPFEQFAKITEDQRAVLANAYSASAIMLSRSGIKKEFKELSMTKVTIKNDKEFEVTVPVIVDGEETQVVIPAGGEIEVEEEQKDAIEAEIAAAEAPAVDPENDPEEDPKDPEADPEEDPEVDPKDAELAKLKKENAEFKKKQIDAEYSKLLAEGKIVPAQERAFKALASLGETKVEFSTKKGNTVNRSVATLLSKFIASSPAVINFSEKGSGAGDDDEAGKEETAYDKLSEEDKAGLKATNVSKEKYNESVEKHPEIHNTNQE